MNATNKFFERLGVAFVVILCVFSSWIFITQALDGLGLGEEGDGKISCEVYYFSNIVNSDPTEVGNYSCDEKYEGGVSELPDLSIHELNIASEAVYQGDITFNGAAINSGTVNGNANFVGDNSENNGTVTGSLTRTYDTSISTSRDFTQDSSPWTVIATNGAVVNVANAIYNGSTIFSTESGGSFVYSVAEETLGAGRFSGVESSKTKQVSAPESWSLVSDLSESPIASNDEAKEKYEEKIVQSEAKAQDEASEITSSSNEVAKIEEVKEVTVSAPKVEGKLPIVQTETAEQLKSKLLSSDDATKVWYVAPNETVRYEVSTNNSLNLFRKVSLGITNKDLAQIPEANSNAPTTSIAKRLVGRFLLQVENRGQTWYVDQLGYKHRVTSENILEVVNKAVVRINNETLEEIPVANTAQ